MRGFSRDALDLMLRYHWPGNVRELRNVVERICIMYNVDEITPAHLPREIWGESPQSEVPFSYEIPPEGIVLDDVVCQVEKGLISKAFTITGGNVARTARILNVPRGTLRYKLEKYELGIDLPG
jgi:two-component system response regulator AtoC